MYNANKSIEFLWWVMYFGIHGKILRFHSAKTNSVYALGVPQEILIKISKSWRKK